MNTSITPRERIINVNRGPWGEEVKLPWGNRLDRKISYAVRGAISAFKHGIIHTMVFFDMPAPQDAVTKYGLTPAEIKAWVFLYKYNTSCDALSVPMLMNWVCDCKTSGGAANLKVPKFTRDTTGVLHTEF